MGLAPPSASASASAPAAISAAAPSSTTSSSSAPVSRNRNLAARGSGPRSLGRAANRRRQGGAAPAAGQRRAGERSRTYVPSDLVQVKREDDFAGAGDDGMMMDDDGYAPPAHESGVAAGQVNYSLPPPVDASAAPVDLDDDDVMNIKPDPSAETAPAATGRRSKFSRGSNSATISAPAAKALKAAAENQTASQQMQSSQIRKPSSSIAGLGQVVTSEMTVDSIGGADMQVSGGNCHLYAKAIILTQPKPN